MKYVFGKSGQKMLEAYSIANTLFAFDFDGTLAKIVSEPDFAQMSQKTAKLLSTLNEMAPVCIISGRSLKDISRRLQAKPRCIVGNHGLEGLPNSQYSIRRAIAACHTWKMDFKKLPLGKHGISIEDKEYSLALHYRKSRTKRITKKILLEMASSLTPSPRIIMGKHVINLIPVGAPHKGMALMELLLECGAATAIYIGDDDTDEDVFCLPENRILTIRVGDKKSSRARYFLKYQGEINRLLEKMIRFRRQA